MNDHPEEDKPWWGNPLTVDDVRARPRRAPTAHQHAALAEAAAVYLEGGEEALAAYLAKQRQEQEARAQAANDPNATPRVSLLDRLKPKPPRAAPSEDVEDSPGNA